jgi:hypothetical protein
MEQTAHDQLNATLWAVLKLAANSPNVPLCHFHILEKLKKDLKCTLGNAVQQAVVQWFRKKSNSLQIGHAKMCINCAPVQIPVTCTLTVTVPSTVSILQRISLTYAAYIGQCSLSHAN